MNTKLLVALDIGGVCVQLDFNRTFSYFGCTHDTMSPELQQLVSDSNCGRISTEGFIKSMQKYAPAGASDQQILDGWESMLRDPMPGMNEAVEKAVAQGVRFVYLSDISESHDIWVQRNLPFAHLVSGGIMSYKVGVCKPDPQIYRAFEETYGKPDLYFDDLQKNIDGGRKAGWNAVQFLNADQFADVIQKKLNTILK